MQPLQPKSKETPPSSSFPDSAIAINELDLELQSVVLRSMAEGVCLIKAEDGTIVYTNPKFEKMFGYQAGEMTGRPVEIVNYQDGITNARQVAAQLMAEIKLKGEASYEVYNVKKDGTPFWCRATSSVFEHPRYGTLLVAVHQDITRHKETELALRTSEQRFRAIFNQSFEFIGLLSPTGILLEANRTALDFGGLKAEDVIGKPFWEIIWWSLSPQTKEQLQLAIIQAATGKLCVMK